MFILVLLLLLIGPAWAQELQRCAICSVTEGAGPEQPATQETYNGKTYYFCSQECHEKFQADPAKSAEKADLVASREGRHELGPLPELELLDQYRGKVLILDFWATWCGPCVAEMPEFVELQKQHPADLQVVGFSYDQDAARHEAFLPRLNYPSVLASEVKPFLKALTKQVGPIKGIPVTLLVDRKGQIIFRQSGVVGDDFRAALREALQ